MTRDYLADAAPGYLNEREIATAPSGWLDVALNYATRLLHGATATLTPVAAGIGSIAGYRVADYLYQHALHARRTEHLPDAVWHALIRHHHSDDTGQLAGNAERRGRDHEALALHQQLADSGGVVAAYRLAGLLAEQGQVDELRARAEHGDARYAVSLAKLGQFEDAIRLLRPHADNHDEFATVRLAELLAEQGQVEEAIRLLRARADNGDGTAAVRLAELLASQGLVEQLRARADNGDGFAAKRLTELLTNEGHVAELEREVAAGTSGAAAALRQVRSHVSSRAD
ncbi:hypothetical protein ACFWMR_04915 [Amycolatopsis thailandensis]|uniref:hypothetical protein n=1 Tax=Amycolatopsis thailandensis TaxID=589330 RepID=UPI0036661D88